MEPIVQFLPLIVIVASIFTYLILSVRIIGPTETGIVVRLGKPVAVKKSGICFFLRVIYKIVIYPTQMYNILIPETDVITKKGEFEGEEYEAATLNVDAVFYFRWPQDEKLIDSYRTAPPPDDPDVLGDHFEEAVQGLMREEGAEITWRQFIENRRNIAQTITKSLKEDKMSPFRLASISEIFFVIRGVALPPELQEALSMPQTEQLLRRGIEQEALAEEAMIRAQGRGYRSIGAWGLFAALFTLVANRKTPPRRR